MYTDTIADMLTRIRNALAAGHATVSMPSATMKVGIAKILKAEGYIENFGVGDETPQPSLRLQLKYVGDRRTRRPVITGIKRISKAGRRVYKGKKDIPWILSGMGIAIISTSKGLMTDQAARRAGLGGEVICSVW